MTSTEDVLKSYVRYGDILAAVYQVHGTDVTLQDFKVEAATKAVQGFTSLMLRVHATVVKNGKEIIMKLVIKRPPVLQAQLEVMKDAKIFQREVAYFNIATPILLKSSSDLAIVKVYVAHGDVLVMEDLNALGFETLGPTAQITLQSEDLLQLSHVRLAVRKLAELHVASLDKDWNAILGDQLKNDPFMHESEMFKNMVSMSGDLIMIAIKELHPETSHKYENFFEVESLFNILLKFISYVPNTLNVLLHGDFWLNNMMFKIDSETKEPIDVKFIDFQIYRYGPPYRDLLYFFYFCTHKSFRDKYEQVVLKTYVDAFNSYAFRTPDLINFESLVREYESHRIFGLCLSAILRPTFLMQDLLPGEGEEMSADLYDKLIHGEHFKMMLKQFKYNLLFRKNVIDLAEEFVLILDKMELRKLIECSK